MKLLLVVLTLLSAFPAYSGLGKKVEGTLVSFNEKSFLLKTEKGKNVRFLFKDTNMIHESELSFKLNKKISFVVPYDKAPK